MKPGQAGPSSSSSSSSNPKPSTSIFRSRLCIFERVLELFYRALMSPRFVNENGHNGRFYLAMTSRVCVFLSALNKLVMWWSISKSDWVINRWVVRLRNVTEFDPYHRCLESVFVYIFFQWKHFIWIFYNLRLILIYFSYI